MLILLALPAAAAPRTQPVARFADEIIRRQAPDGAIVQDRLSPATNRVVPYFSNLAALGLLSAHSVTHDVRYLRSAKKWAAWYAAHMNADGTVYDHTGAPGAWKPTGEYDSTDSYAATYLELLDGIARVDKPWAVARYASAGNAVKAIILTLQPVGLTLAKPMWPVMYVMDNVETSRGLRAAAHLASLCGKTIDGKDWAARADRMEKAIETSLWDPGRNCYLVGLQPDGGKMRAAGEWYPGVMANLMAISWAVPSKRHAKLYANMLKQPSAALPALVKTEDDMDHLVWWGLAARAAGDATRLRDIASKIEGCDPKAVPLPNTALLGQACRLLASRKEN
ncbi:MAG TPA: hypothetical protein VGM51_04675 [Armatimonadota bacterium]|jgi:hypothetical protein